MSKAETNLDEFHKDKIVRMAQHLFMMNKGAHGLNLSSMSVCLKIIQELLQTEISTMKENNHENRLSEM